MMGVRGSVIPLILSLSMGTGAVHSQDVGEKLGHSLTSMDHYAPLPTADQLDQLSRELGRPTRFDQRIVGGLGGTVDVLIVGHDPGEAVVLKRYWLPQSGEISPAESEFRALALAVEHGVSAPTPIWIDRIGLFPERAIVISHVEGGVLLSPSKSDRLGGSTRGSAHRSHPSDPTCVRGSRPLPGTDHHRRSPVRDGNARSACADTHWAWISGGNVSRLWPR